jgi:hypothetical protein
LGVVWIYLTHAAHLHAVLKRRQLAAVYCKTNCWLFKVMVVAVVVVVVVGGVMLDLEVTKGYGVLCSG